MTLVANRYAVPNGCCSSTYTFHHISPVVCLIQIGWPAVMVCHSAVIGALLPDSTYVRARSCMGTSQMPPEEATSPDQEGYFKLGISA